MWMINKIFLIQSAEKKLKNLKGINEITTHMVHIN